MSTMSASSSSAASTSGGRQYPGISSASVTNLGRLEVTWSTGDVSHFPSIWLRDNCQCSDCYSQGSVARKLLMDGYQDSKPILASVTVISDQQTEQRDENIVRVQWTDGHEGTFSNAWLHGRRFEPQQREQYRNLFQLPKRFWGPNFELPRYDYSQLMSPDQSSKLFDFLTAVEEGGAALVQGVPPLPQAARDLTEHIGGGQTTHYGRFSSVKVQDDPENVSYSNFSLNLHNDLPQYQNQPGIILLHMLQQHRGTGGDTTISDGVAAAQEIRERHPREFHLLTRTRIYFLAKGTDTNHDGTRKDFFKINKEPVIKLDCNGEIISTHFNNQGRESHVDLSVEETEVFYDALLLFFRTIKKHSVRLRLSDGDMAVIDNHRCQHGRLGFTGQSSRHLVTTYMSWDEARCCRRRLQEAAHGQVI